MKTVHAVWEMENIGQNTYEITLDENDSMDRFIEEDRRCITAGAQYIVVKTPVNRPDFLFSMNSLGYQFVETVYHVQIKRKAYHMPEAICRFDRDFTVIPVADDITAKERMFAFIRKGIFMTDRVSIDPFFGPIVGGNRYANWLASMMQNGGDAYEVLLKNKPIGFFVICRKDETTVDPVLMGLYNEAEDRGIGTLLHKKTLDTCFTYDCNQLTSTIVSNNAKIFSVYLNAGASITNTLYTYVKHV